MTLWLLFHEESERYEYDSRCLEAIYSSKEEAINRFNAEIDGSSQKDRYGEKFSRWNQELELNGFEILRYYRDSRGLVSQAWVIEAWEIENVDPDEENSTQQPCKGTVACPDEHHTLYADELSLKIGGKVVRDRLDSLVEACFSAFSDVNPREIAGLIVSSAINQAEKKIVIWQRACEDAEE